MTYLKIFRAVWSLTVLALLANMLYVYASLPINVLILQNGPDQVVLSRDVSFYIALFGVALVNVMVYVTSVVYRQNILFRTWFNGLVICMNIFFIGAFSFIGIFNSGEHYEFSRMGAVVYGSIVLFAGWALSWPVILAIRRLMRVSLKPQS